MPKFDTGKIARMCFDCGEASCDAFTKRNPEIVAMQSMVDGASVEMKLRLIEKHAAGRRGWDDAKRRGAIVEGLNRSIAEKRWIDAANLCVMLWNLDQEDADREAA